MWRLESESLIGDIQRRDFDEAKTNEDAASRVLVESRTIDSNDGTACLWAKSRRELVDEWILVVFESAVGVTQLAASIKRDVDIEPCALAAIDDVALLVHETWGVAVNERGVNDGGVGEHDWLLATVS